MDSRLQTNSVLGKLKKATGRPGERAAGLVKDVFRKMGVAVYPCRADYHYCPEVYGSHHQRLVDIQNLEIFGDLAQEVISHGRTYLYYDRLYYLYQAIGDVSHLLGARPNLAEVGVYKGGGTYFIASVVARLFRGKPLIHAFDTFAGHPDDIEPELDGRH